MSATRHQRKAPPTLHFHEADTTRRDHARRRGGTARGARNDLLSQNVYGVGKTTTMRLILGLDHPDAGAAK
jgi:hypothetical protein